MNVKVLLVVVLSMSMGGVFGYLGRVPFPAESIDLRKSSQPEGSLAGSIHEPAAYCIQTDGSITALREDVARLHRLVETGLSPGVVVSTTHQAGYASAVGTHAGVDQELVLPATARAILDTAIATASWTDGDAQELNEIAHTLSEAQKFEILARLSVAMNDGLIDVQTLGPPF